MSQTQQYKKVKHYRNLKIAFYALGLPLFLLAVFFTSVRFLGHDPFMGGTEITTQLGFFKQVESYITAPALYGVWIGFGVWAFITIVHIILSKTVKNARVRMFAVVAVCMVAMLGTGLVLDVVYEGKVADLQEKYANTGVSIPDYKTQLSYYRTLSSNAAKKSETTKLIDQIGLLKNVYNVEMEGADKSGAAGNISNKPITYYNIIDDEGNQGVDIRFVKNEKGLYQLDVTSEKSGDGIVTNNTITGDGDLESILDHSYRVDPDSIYAKDSSLLDYRKSPEYQTEITLAPNVNGQLVINGKVYSHYWYQQKTTKAGEKIYVWYAKDLIPLGTTYTEGKSKTNAQDGIWGKGIYNSNGLFGDGWVYSLDNVLEILEDYYSAQAEIDSNKAYAENYDYIYSEAVAARIKYYNGTLADPVTGEYASAWEQQLFKNEFDFADRFSLTQNGLDFLLAQVGQMLGSNSLFDFLLKVEDETTGLEEVLGQFGVGAILQPILEKLANGMSLKEFGVDDATMATVVEWVCALTGVDSATAASINELYLVVAYAGAENVFDVSVPVDGLSVYLVTDDGAGAMGLDQSKVADGGNVLIDFICTNRLLEVREDGTTEYVFDLEHLDALLGSALNGLMDKFGLSVEQLVTGEGDGILATIGGLIGPNGLIKLVKSMTIDGETYYGLEISGMSIPLINEDYEFEINLEAILLDLLGSLYYYQSPCIKPVWEFYTWECGEKALGNGKTMQDAAIAYRDFQKAEYQAVTFGSTIGSTLVGDTLGTGAYPSALGLANLTAVQQLKADLEYKSKFYPVYGVRDMLYFFTGTVVLFYYLSFVAAQKEEEYANGTLVVKERKRSKKSKDSDDKNGNDGIATLEIHADDEGNSPVGEEGAILPDDQNTIGGAEK